MKKTKRKFRFDIGSIIAFIFLTLYCCSIVYLLYFILQTSLKSRLDFTLDKNVFGLPNFKKYGFSLNNYVKVFQDMSVGDQNIAQMLGNSLLYSFGCTVFSVFAKMITAYFCAKYDTALGKWIHTIVIVTMILPIVGTTSSTIDVLRSLNMYNTFWGNFLLHASFTGMYFLIFYSAFKGIPDGYGEAAKIDGAGHFMIMIRIYIPMIVPTIFAASIMLFIGFYNDFNSPLLYMNKYPTISYGLLVFAKSGNNANQTMRMASCLLACLPMIVLFVAFRNKIMGNLTAGGLKG